MNGFYILVSVSSIIAILITYFLGRFFKERAIVKYIPAIISALSCLGFYIKSKYFSIDSGFADLGYIVMMLIAFIVFCASFITALIMGLVQRNKRKNH